MQAVQEVAMSGLAKSGINLDDFHLKKRADATSAKTLSITVAWAANDVLNRKNLLHPTKGHSARSTLKGMYESFIKQQDLPDIDEGMRKRIEDTISRFPVDGKGGTLATDKRPGPGAQAAASEAGHNGEETCAKRRKTGKKSADTQRQDSDA